MVNASSKSNFIAFLLERQNIYLRRQAGSVAPWTDDPILRKYRFCNIERENDRTTAWIAKNLRSPLAGSTLLIPVLAAARLINRIETLELLKARLLMRGWSESEDVPTLREIAASGSPITNSAYMVTTPEGMDKAAGLSFMISKIQSDGLCLSGGFSSLRSMHEHLMTFPRIGSFLAAQIVADAKYVPRYRMIKDWVTFAASGPGSRRGLNRLLGRPVGAAWQEDEWFSEHSKLHSELLPQLAAAGLPYLHAQDLNNCECEFDKYERVRLKEGEPKQLFRPSTTEEGWLL